MDLVQNKSDSWFVINLTWPLAATKLWEQVSYLFMHRVVQKESPSFLRAPLNFCDGFHDVVRQRTI